MESNFTFLPIVICPPSVLYIAPPPSLTLFSDLLSSTTFELNSTLSFIVNVPLLNIAPPLACALLPENTTLLEGSFSTPIVVVPALYNTPAPASSRLGQIRLFSNVEFTIVNTFPGFTVKTPPIVALSLEKLDIVIFFNVKSFTIMLLLFPSAALKVSSPLPSIVYFPVSSSPS